MDVSELRAWAKKMGYPGQIPDDFELLNESTAHIWKQVVQRLKPKHEIQQIQRNILVQKLKALKTNHYKYKKPTSSNISDCPNKEYDTWMRKNQLENEVKRVKSKLSEVKEEISRLEDENNVLLTEIELMNAKMKESEAKTYLYQKKSENLSESIKFIETKIKSIDNLICAMSSSVVTTKLPWDVENIAGSLKINEEIETNENVNDLYKNHSPNELINVINDKKNLLKAEIMDLIKEDSGTTQNIKRTLANTKAKNTSKLHALHVQKSLEIIKLKRIIHQKEIECLNKQLEIFEKFSDVKNQIENDLKLQEEAILKQFDHNLYENLKDDIKLLQPRQGASSAALRKEKQLLIKARHGILSKIETYKQMDEKISLRHYAMISNLQNVRNASFLVNCLIGDLSKSLVSKEVQTAMIFNLEFNRKCSYLKERKDLFYRDTWKTYLPFVSCDEEVVFDLVRSLGLPVSDQEGIVKYFERKLWEMRQFEEYLVRSEELKEFSELVLGNKSKGKYKLKDLQASYKSLMAVVDDLQAVAAKDFFPTLNRIKHSCQLWLEMPFGKYIPQSVLYKGENYEYYEEQFETYFKQL